MLLHQQVKPIKLEVEFRLPLDPIEGRPSYVFLFRKSRSKTTLGLLTAEGLSSRLYIVGESRGCARRKTG